MVAVVVPTLWLQMGPGGRYMIDLDVFRAAGRALLHGRPLYGAGSSAGLSYRLPFLYPPLAAVLLAPISLVPRAPADWVWDLATVAVLVACARAAFAPLLGRLDRLRLAGLAAVTAAVLATAPVADHLSFGQVGVFLMGLCVADCAAPQPRWPRGALVGLATAVKLVPGIFVVYLWITGRRRAAATAIATAALATALGAAVDPSGSVRYWTHVIFATGAGSNVSYFSNQSLLGIVGRVVPPFLRAPAWLAGAAAVGWFGLRGAARAARRGHELVGVAVAGLVGVLLSPISWINHLVWLVLILGVLVGDGRRRARLLVAGLLWAVLVLRLPYVGHHLAGTGPWWLAEMLQDSYGLACLVVVLALPRAMAQDRRPMDPTSRPIAAEEPASPRPGHVPPRGPV